MSRRQSRRRRLPEMEDPLECVDNHVRLLVDGYYPEKEIRTAEISAAVPHVAACPRSGTG